MKKRILSALIMVLVFIPLLYIGGSSFAIFMSILALLSLYELLKIKDKKDKLPFFVKICAYLMVLFMSLNNMDAIDFHYMMDYRMISVIIFIFTIPIVFIHDNQRYNISDSLYLIGSTLFLGFSFNLLIILRNYDLMYLIYLFLISTITDIFALVTGQLIGKTKLCPSVSPGKTVEGLIGGTFMGVFVASSFYHVFMNPSYSLVMLIFITASLSLVGQIGDLVFSMIKRYYNQKDFSNLIPGHGGVLDRFDSIIFIVLAFILIIGMI